MGKIVILLRFKLVLLTGTLCVASSISLPVSAQTYYDEGGFEETEVVVPEAEVIEEPEAPPPEPITASNPAIAVEQLELLLKPLRQEQLEVEAEAWTTILQEKAQQITDLELRIQQQTGQEVTGDVDTQKEQNLVAVTNLQTEQTAIASRVTTVLDALEAKGGEAESYRQYVQAVSGLDLDLSDAEGIGLRFNTWLQSEEGGIRWGINLLKVLGILIVTAIVAPRAGKVTRAILSRTDNISTLFSEFIVTMVKRAIWVGGALLSLAAIGVSLGPLLALIGGASFVLAFALQSNLGNFASGLTLLVYKPFDVGDEVEIGGNWAIIKDITLASTVLQVWDQGRIITIPNSTVWSSTIVNHTPKDGFRKIVEKVNINVNEDLGKAKRVMDEVLQAHPLVVKDFWAGTFVWAVQEYAQVFYVARCKAEDYWTLYEDLVLQLHSRLREEGIVFAIPEQHVTLRKNVESGAYEQIKTLESMEHRTQEKMGLDFEAEPG